MCVCCCLIKAEYSNCVSKLEKELVTNYQKQFETLFKAEAPTWETHGNLMVRRPSLSSWPGSLSELRCAHPGPAVPLQYMCVCVCVCVLQTERQVSRWFLQCLREQSLLLEILFLYYAYFEMGPTDLLSFTKMFKEQGFGQRQTNRHLVDKSMDALVDRIG